MPALDALQKRFIAANTQILGLSVDSKFSHGGWAKSLGGISYPLLADFHPKGAVAESYGMFLGEKGISDRATVVIDAGGVVRHSSSVTPAGERDISALAALCEKVSGAYEGTLPAAAKPVGIGDDATLYVKNSCGFSRWVLEAHENLHLGGKVGLKNVSDDAAAMAEMEKATGKQQAPALVVGGKAMLESAEIIEHMRVATVGF